jgi:hypothetical protein
MSAASTIRCRPGAHGSTIVAPPSLLQRDLPARGPFRSCRHESP